MSLEIKTAKVWEDSTAVMLARVVGADGDAIVQADIETITCKVMTLAGTVVVSPTVTVNTAVFDTLQTGDEWTEDAIGYNFRHALPVTAVPNGGTIYQVEYIFTAADESVFPVVYRITTENLLGS